jgi:MFS family permease
MAGWQGFSQILALLSGSLAGVALTSILSEEQLYSWGWRLPFLLGILIAPVGLYIRRQLPETIQPSEMHASSRAILGELARHHARPVLLGVLVICGGTVSTYVFTYMTTYAITTLHLSPAVGTSLSAMGYVAQLLGGVAGVWADRFGRKAVLTASRLVFAASIYPAFVVLTSPESSLAALFAVYMAISAMFSMGIVPVYAFLLEAFPKAVRSSGLSILYALGTTIFGGTTQFVVAWLIDRTGDPMVPAWYMLATTIAATIGVLGLMPHPDVAREHATAAAAARA